MRPFYILSLLSLFGTGCQKKASLDHLQELNELCQFSVYKDAPNIPLLQLETAPASSNSSPTIWLSEETILFNYYSFQKPSELQDSLKEQQEIIQYTGIDSGISIAISPKTTAEKIIDVLNITQDSGFTKINFLFESTKSPSLPAPPNQKQYQKTNALIHNAAPEIRQTILAEELYSQVRFCRPMKQAFHAVASAAPESRCPLLIRGAEEAIPYCPVMTARGMTSTLQVFFESDIYPIAHSIEITPEVGKLVIPKDYTWEQIAPLVLEQTRIGGLDIQNDIPETVE